MVDSAPPLSWAAPALLGAGLAVLGYVGNLLANFVLDRRKVASDRRGRLAELLALLRAGDVTFEVQSAIRGRLSRQLLTRRPDVANGEPGFDELFARAYAGMTPEELRLHAIIRAYTIYTLKPLNDDLIAWLRGDRYFRALPPDHKRLGSLALFLAQLEAHLLLWRAKYEAWIPGNKERCLVYLADEGDHGIRFPRDGSKLVAEALGHPVLKKQLPVPAGNA